MQLCLQFNKSEFQFEYVLVDCTAVDTLQFVFVGRTNWDVTCVGRSGFETFTFVDTFSTVKKN